MENWKLCNPLLVVYDVYEKTASYIDIKYLLLFLQSILLSNKILKYI
jgi:hypothetical protein